MSACRQQEKDLLGFEKVRNSDRSWTEWDNLMEAPIEKGEAKAAGGVS
jgi:3-mercaptopyruvate sulfurtransferase SseA